MMVLRHYIIGGAVGFFGGMLYKNKNPIKKFEIFAANPVEIDPANVANRMLSLDFPCHDTVIRKNSFVLSYDRRNRVPHWVFEHLTAEHIAYNEFVNTKIRDFVEDDSIHAYFRSTDEDYRESGFDKGHLAAASNHRSKQEYLDDTFVLSNTAPQVGKGFNQDKWEKLEKHVSKLVEQYKNVYVCTGPLYLPSIGSDGKKYVKYQVIGPQEVAVPTHFFKVFVGERPNSTFDMEAYVMPNAPIDKKDPLNKFLVSKEKIEKAAGLLLFENLPSSALHSINGKRVFY